MQNLTRWVSLENLMSILSLKCSVYFYSFRNIAIRTYVDIVDSPAGDSERKGFSVSVKNPEKLNHQSSKINRGFYFCYTGMTLL